VEWAFLRSSALNDFHDRWVDAAAIQTLKLIASSRSLALLEEVRQRNTERPKSCARAIDYVLSNPPELRDDSLQRLAKRVAEVNGIGEWQGNRNTRYNVAGDKALIDVVYDTGEDIFIYTATFHRVDGLWRLRGFRETLQQFAIRAIVPAPPLPDLTAPPDIPLNPLPADVEDLLRSLPPLKPPNAPAPPPQKN
jgi:hypothetical protein